MVFCVFFLIQENPGLQHLAEEITKNLEKKWSSDRQLGFDCQSLFPGLFPIRSWSDLRSLFSQGIGIWLSIAKKVIGQYYAIFYKSWKSLQMQKVVLYLVFSYKPVQQSSLESWHIQYLFLIKRLLRGTTESSLSILDTMYIYWWISHTYPAVWFWLGKKKSFLYFLTG